MRLATIRLDGTTGSTRAVRVDDDAVVDLDAPDVATLLRQADWREIASSATTRLSTSGDVDYAPLIFAGAKTICVGQNYRAHIAEMGRQPPEYPTLFAKYPSALVGAFDDVVLPHASSCADWEAELGVVIGHPVRHASESQASAAIAGYTVVNDVSIRDWQYRTTQWLQGKTFERTTPVGPWLAVADDQTAALVGGRPDLAITCEVDGETVQSARTSDLVFDPIALVRYVSTMFTLEPGDLIATGTPGGVGHARTPPRYLVPGAVVTTRIEHIGECRNRCVAEEMTDR